MIDKSDWLRRFEWMKVILSVQHSVETALYISLTLIKCEVISRAFLGLDKFVLFSILLTELMILQVVNLLQCHGCLNSATGQIIFGLPLS